MSKKRDYSNWSKEELIREIEALRKQKTYGLVWEKDKTKELFDYYMNWDGVKNKENFKDTQNKFPVLKELTNKEIKTDIKRDFDILIEGDNYHALAVLNFTHKKSIDVIYIDPPYNTGNEDFKYNDQWVDLEDAYRHSKWLSFMEKRLKLAKNLLKETGSIFISIDDNEQAQLKILCDEIFGEQNFVSTIVWQKKYSPQNDARHLSDMHDFILLYARNKTKWKRNLIPRTELQNSRYSNPDNDKRGDWKAADLSVKTLTPKDVYEITTPSGRKILPPKSRSWSVSKEKFEELVKDNRIWFGKGENNVPALKTFLSEVQEGVVPVTWWDRNFAGDNQEAKQEMKIILGKQDVSFDTPKPVRLIERILQLSSTKNSIVLDFFAGSGTTGQTVLKMNKDDDGNRRYILCTNNEGNICTEVCYPRLKHAIEGYVDKEKRIEGLGGNLKYLITDFVDSAPTDKNKRKIVDKSTEMICLKENAFNIVKDKGSKYKIFKNSNIHLGIIFDPDYIDEFVDEAKKLDGKVNVYVFSLDDTVPEDEFKEIKNKVNLCPIPEVILHVYRKVFKQ